MNSLASIPRTAYRYHILDFTNSDEYKCAICLDILIEPRFHAACEAEFCKSCSNNLGICRTCPYCNVKFNLKLSGSNKSTKKKLNSLKVVCTSCNHICNRILFPAHYYKKCIIMCECGEQITRNKKCTNIPKINKKKEMPLMCLLS